jgi:hypothetical protein
MKNHNSFLGGWPGYFTGRGLKVRCTRRSIVHTSSMEDGADRCNNSRQFDIHANVNGAQAMLRIVGEENEEPEVLYG